jgi:XTP/dITP diphosphohydrolase
MTLVLATRNAHKAKEVQQILGAAFDVRTMTDFGSPPPLVEDADTFRGNAEKKASQLAEWLASAHLPSDTWVIADDSGLEVDALAGAPGVHSARFAAETAGNAPDTANNAKLLKLLQGVPPEKRTARFRCAIAITPVLRAQPESASPVCYANESEFAMTVFEGGCEGTIATTPSGIGGFGYDPLFIPRGYSISFAELGDDVKNQISHRARALAKLQEHLSRGR